MNVLFWNINRKNLRENIFRIVEKHDIDIVVLAESNFVKSELLLTLNKNETAFYLQHPLSNCDKIQIYTRFNHEFIRPVYEKNRYTIRRLSLPGKIEILFTAVHFVDKGNHSDQSQSEEASIMAGELFDIEKEQQLIGNVIVGDFNMNPFEHGMIKANGFHATMSGSIAKSRKRIVQGRDYRYLYNPMWSLYGDLNEEPVGTYHYKHAEMVNYQWNVFDQVLIRPSLVDRFRKDKLAILTNDGSESLVNDNGLPKKGELHSDHLPIIFSIDLNQ